MLGKIHRRYRRWKLDWHFDSNPKESVFDFENSDRIYLHKDEVLYKLYTTNDFVNNNHALWGGVVQPGMTVFDVGANCGIYSLAASRQVGGSWQFYSFEPNLREREKLVSNNLALCENPGRGSVTIQVEAIGEYAGETQFFIPEAFKGAYSAIRRPEIQEKCQELNVPITTIDIFFTKQELSSIDVIKMDVEGIELNVLKGGQETLVSHQPFVFMEMSDRRTKVYNYKARELCDLLLEQAYTLFECQRINDDGVPVVSKYTQSDYISYVDVFVVPWKYGVSDLIDNGIVFEDKP